MGEGTQGWGFPSKSIRDGELPPSIPIQLLEELGMVMDEKKLSK